MAINGRLMKRIVVVASLLGVLALSCTRKSEEGASSILFGHHFLGSTGILQDTNAARLQQIAALPSSRLVRQEVVRKLAAASAPLLRGSAVTDVEAALLEPIIDGLIAAESFSEIRGPANRPEAVLAVRLNDVQAGVWRSNLWRVLSPRGANSDLDGAGSNAWMVTNAQSRVIQFARAGDWVLLGAGSEKLKLLPKWISGFASGSLPGRQTNQVWLEVEADLPRLKGWLPFLQSIEAPAVRLAMSGDGDNVRTRARFVRSERIPWIFEPWQIPTNLINDPIVGFTAVQGIAPLLEDVEAVQQLGLGKVPNQLYVWSQSTVHVQAFAAIPMPDATNAMRKLAVTIPPLVFAALEKPIGDFLYASNRAELLWRGLPFIVPYARPVADGGGELVMVGLFPAGGKTNPPPPELYAQLRGRKDLVYYDWEITEQRLIHARQLYQLANIIVGRHVPDKNLPTQKWINEAAPLLGNSVTEITVASAREFGLVRKSHLGFTGPELMALLSWVESPGFPLRFELPPRDQISTNVLGRARTNRVSTPAATNKPPAPARKLQSPSESNSPSPQKP